MSWRWTRSFEGSPGGSDSKESACNAKDLGWIPGSGKSSGEENGNPLQYSCLKNSIDREVQWAIVNGAAKSLIWICTWYQQRVYVNPNFSIQPSPFPLSIHMFVLHICDRELLFDTPFFWLKTELSSCPCSIYFLDQIHVLLCLIQT